MEAEARKQLGVRVEALLLEEKKKRDEAMRQMREEDVSSARALEVQRSLDFEES